MSESPDTGAGLLLSDDLMFASRITGSAKALGLNVKVARSPNDLLALAKQQLPSCILVDLSNPGLKIADLVQGLRETCIPWPRIVAYGSHVDTATLRAAQEAGCDQVLPRSKFVQELPSALPSWLAKPGGGNES